MSYRTDNPVADAERYANDAEGWLMRRPRCILCKDHIQQDRAIRYKGGLVCEDCEDDLMRNLFEEYASENIEYIEEE